MEIGLRPGLETDVSLLLECREALRPYAVQTYGTWDEAAQDAYVRDRLAREMVQVIEADGEAVGMLVTEESDAETVIQNILVLPTRQNQGIGSRVLGDLLAEAHAHGRAVRLRVMKVNPARRLYERLGFVVTVETETHWLMLSPPPEAASDGS